MNSHLVVIVCAGLVVIVCAGLVVIESAGLVVIECAGLVVIVCAGLVVIESAGLVVIECAGLVVIESAGYFSGSYFCGDYKCHNSSLIQQQGGSNPIFAHGKNVSFFPFFPMGKKYMAREGNEYFSQLFPYTFFPIFSHGEKWEKTHFSHGQKWGWTPPPSPTLSQRSSYNNNQGQVYRISKVKQTLFKFCIKHFIVNKLLGMMATDFYLLYFKIKDLCYHSIL